MTQLHLTITYRFSEPNQPLPILLHQPLSPTGRTRVPAELKTIGDHIRKKRLCLKLLQRQVAELIGVDKTSVFNWEANASSPELKFIPAIVDFLGYDPLPEAQTWGERLVRHRSLLGLTQKQAAEKIGIDPLHLVGVSVTIDIHLAGSSSLTDPPALRIAHPEDKLVSQCSENGRAIRICSARC